MKRQVNKKMYVLKKTASMHYADFGTRYTKCHKWDCSKYSTNTKILLTIKTDIFCHVFGYIFIP